MKYLAAVIGGLMIATPALAAGVKLPAYSLDVSLSAKAAAKLSSSGETIHVSAMYYGSAKPGVKGDEAGQIQLGAEEIDIPKAGLLKLGQITLKPADIKKIKEKQPLVLINVYTSRKVFADNLLDCGLFQDKVTVAAKKPVKIACKLIGE